MNQTRCIVILSILALFVASVSVAGNISLPDASQKVFEGKPCINSPRAIGNYPASPFLFYIPLPVSGRWNGVRRNFRKD